MQGLQRFTSIFKISQGPATSLPETLDLRNAANTRTPIRNSNSENGELEVCKEAAEEEEDGSQTNYLTVPAQWYPNYQLKITSSSRQALSVSLNL